MLNTRTASEVDKATTSWIDIEILINYNPVMLKRRLRENQIKKIKSLRQKGQSVPEISRSMHIAKSTVFHHVKGVEILSRYKVQWLGKRGGSIKRMHLREKNAFEKSRKLIKNLSHKEKLLFLAALYWAEGSKRDCWLTNTDPNLIKVYVNTLREDFQISDDRLRISVRIYEDLDQEKCLDFWSSVVNIPKEKFVSVNILKGKKKGKLEYGMCRVRVIKGCDLLKEIVAINKIVTSFMSP